MTDDYADPMTVVNNIYNFVNSVTEAIKKDPDTSIYDIYHLLANMKGELGTYICAVTSKVEPVVIEPAPESDEDSE